MILARAKSNLLGMLSGVNTMSVVKTVDKRGGIIALHILVIEDKVNASLVECYGKSSSYHILSM